MRRAPPPSAARNPTLLLADPVEIAVHSQGYFRQLAPPLRQEKKPSSPFPSWSGKPPSLLRLRLRPGAPLDPSRSPPSVLFGCPQAGVFVARGGTADPMACGGRARGAALAVALAVVLCSLSSSPVSSSPEEEFVRKTVSAHEIVVFSKSYCPYCKRAKAVFKELGKVPYVIELDQREDGSDVQDALIEVVGRRTVPQVFINGKHIGGSDDTVEAYQTGALAKLLGIEPKDDL